MITRFPGKRYDFEIRLDGDSRFSAFSIRAICKDTLKYSSINNLNTILSILGIDADNRKYEDSWWELTTREANKLATIIKQDLPSPYFIDYLEGKLD
jgi:hypothetical protein